MSIKYYKYIILLKKYNYLMIIKKIIIKNHNIDNINN